MKIQLNKEGTIFNEDKSKKIEYIKIGSEYHFRVYNLIKDKKSIRYEPINEAPMVMSKNQLENYIYAEIYI